MQQPEISIHPLIGRLRKTRAAGSLIGACRPFLLRTIMAPSDTNEKHHNMIIFPLFMDAQSFSMQEIISLASLFPILTLLCTMLLRIFLYFFTL